MPNANSRENPAKEKEKTPTIDHPTFKTALRLICDLSTTSQADRWLRETGATCFRLLYD